MLYVHAVCVHCEYETVRVCVRCGAVRCGAVRVCGVNTCVLQLHVYLILLKISSLAHRIVSGGT